MKDGETPGGAPPVRDAGPDARRRVAFWAGSFSAALGAAVMAGWHAGSVVLTTIQAEFRPMAYLTAVGLVLGGIALASLAAGRRSVTVFFGGVLAGVGLIRTVEHILGIPSGFDALVPAAIAAASGRTSPVTSASFALIGLSLVELCRAPSRRSPLAAAVGGSIVSGVGWVAVGGYVVGNPVYSRGPLTGMALHTGIALVVLGGGLLSMAWSMDALHKIDKLAPLLLLAAGLTATLSVSQAMDADRADSQDTALRLHARDLAARAVGEIRSRSDALFRMARRLEAMPATTQYAFESDARLYLTHYRGFLAIARAQDAAGVEWAVPSGAMAALRRDPSVDDALRRARREAGGQRGFGAPFRLAPSGTGLILLEPVGPGSARDAIVGVLRLDTLLDSIWAEELAAGHLLALRAGERTVYARNAPEAAARAVPDVPLEVGGLALRLSIGPTPEDARPSRLPLAAAVAGAVMSALLALLLYLFRRARARTRDAESARRLLEREARDRERTARALAGSEARFRAMSEASPLGLFLTDDSGGLIYANEAYERITGLTPDQARGTGWTNALHPEDREAVVRRSAAALTGPSELGRPPTFEDSARFVHAGGESVWVEVKVAAVMQGERVTGYVGAMEDVTERRRNERELRERTRLAAFAADVGAALTRRDGLKEALADCARAMVHHLGGSTSSIWLHDEPAAELVLQAAAGFGATLPDFRDRVPVGRYRLGRIVRDRKPQLSDLGAETAQEDDRDWARSRGMVSFVGYPLIARNRVVGVMSMFADHPLTEEAVYAIASVADQIALGMDRARAIEALAVSEARTRSILDQMLVGLITADEKAVIESVNPAAQRIFGYSESELVGQSLARLMPIPAGGDPQELLREAYHKSIGKVTEWEARRKDGQIFPMELALFAFATPEGRRFAGSLRDISERREVERLKREFVSTVSHELRTPLVSIRGSLGLLAGGVLGRLEGEAAEVVEIAARNVERLMVLINDLLDLERLDGARLTLEIGDVEVDAVIRRSLESIGGFADTAGVSVVAEPGSGRVRGDEARLVQVLVNLLSNAVKFSPRGSTVRVGTVEGPGYVEIRVSDQGRGIPPDFRDVIFQRFRQVEASDARRKGGTGLGLAISKAIVEMHGGRIGVDSEEGRGSTFWFRIPTVEAAVRVGPAARRAAS